MTLSKVTPSNPDIPGAHRVANQQRSTGPRPQILRLLAAGLAALACQSPVQAGTFNNEFNSDPSAAIEIRDVARWEPTGGVGGSGYITLTDAIGSQQGTIVLPDLDAGKTIGGFTATFKLRIGGGTATPADGFSFSLAKEDNAIVSGGTVSEEGASSGFSLNFDTYDNGSEAPALDVKMNGQLVSRTWFGGTSAAGRNLFKDPQGNVVSLGTGDSFADVKIEFKDNLLNVQFKGLDVYKNLFVPFEPIAGRFVFGARTGGSTDNHWIDSLSITTTPAVTLVKSLSPLPGATDVATSTTIDVALVDGTQQVQANSVQLTFNGQTVTPTVSKPAGSDTTTITFDPPGDLPPESPATVKLVYRDNATPPNTKTVDYSFTTRATTATLIAIDDKTIWRFDRTATDLGTAWREKSFNDTAWEQGPALIADETGATPEPIRTPISRFNDAGDYCPTIYFRIHFNFTGNPAAARLQLRHIVDDGALFYLNGVEVHRFGYAAGVNVLFNNTSATGHEAAYAGPYELSTKNLVQGDNVLAVEVHQSGTGSSDIVFGAVLEAILSNPIKTAIDTISPAPGAFDVAVDSTISITLRDGAQKVQPNTVQLTVNGQTVTPTVTKGNNSVTTVTYKPAANFPEGSTVAVKLVFSDDATPPNVTTREFTFATKGGTPLLAIDDKTIWRFDRSATDRGTTWKEKTYNDSTWEQGPALIAEEPGATVEPIRTAISRFNDAGDYVSTLYVRTHFNFTGDPKAVKLALRHVVDDGVIFYLNGVEVHRFGYAAGVNVLFNNTGATSHENAYEGPFDISTASLVVGDNVLAAEVHQSGTGSSDLVFGAELRALGSGAPPVTTAKFTSVARSGNNFVIEWTGAGSLQSADAVTGPWTDVANARSPFSAAISGSKFYRLK